jgi:hypothetical protein
LSEPNLPLMTDESLVSLYADRWAQIHHLDELDLRSVVLVVTATTGAVISLRGSLEVTTGIQVSLVVLSLVVCLLGLNTCIRNRVSFEYAISAVDAIEAVIHGRRIELFGYAGGYHPPRTFRRFVTTTLASIRGPIIGFFSAAAIAISWLAGLQTISGDRLNGVAELLPGLFGSVFWPGVVLIVFADNWRRARKVFDRMGRNS